MFKVRYSYLPQQFAAYIGVRQVVALNSGTDALILGMRALGLGRRPGPSGAPA